MLALKKKREAEAAAKKLEEPTTETTTPISSSSDSTVRVSLLGIGGQKKTKSGTESKTGKKRTPGEIRIQKGECGSFISVALVNRVFKEEQRNN